MKKMITVLAFLLLGTAAVFAETAAPAPAATPAPAVVEKALTGTLTAVTKTSITVKSTDGKTTITLTVPASAKLTGLDKKPVALAKLAKGAKVEVKYTDKADTLVELTLVK